jgi:hypothetical protein
MCSRSFRPSYGGLEMALRAMERSRTKHQPRKSAAERQHHRAEMAAERNHNDDDSGEKEQKNTRKKMSKKVKGSDGHVYSKEISRHAMITEWMLTINTSWPRELCYILTTYLVDDLIIRVGDMYDIAIAERYFHPLPWQVPGAVTIQRLQTSTSSNSHADTKESAFVYGASLPTSRWYGGEVKRIRDGIITISILGDSTFKAWCACPIRRCNQPSKHVRSNSLRCLPTHPIS